MSHSITLAGGGLRIPRGVYDTYFAGLEAVVLLRRDDDLLILPVRNAASGGYLLKLRNSAGDRVVHADDFFRAQGVAGGRDRDLPVAWSAEQGALVSPAAFEL